MASRPTRRATGTTRHDRAELRGARGAVDREVHARNDRKLVRLLKNAHLKYGQAAIEDIDARSGPRHRPPRGDEPGIGGLGQRRPLRPDHRPDRRRQVVVGVRTGTVRLPACLLGDLPACTALAGILRIRHGSGAFGKWLLQLAKTDVLVLDLCVALSYVESSQLAPT